MPDHTERVLAELEHPQFAEVDEWNNVPIPVPPVAASGLPFCHIIEIAYRLKVSCIETLSRIYMRIVSKNKSWCF